jgi:hypothetical protein
MFVLIAYMILYMAVVAAPLVMVQKNKFLTNFIALILCTVYNRSHGFLSPAFETDIHHICSAYAFFDLLV